MNVQKRVDFHWNLRKLMAERNLWKSTELVTLLRSRGVTLSQPQAYRLMTGKPERINSRVLAALCDILDCSPPSCSSPWSSCRDEPPHRPPTSCPLGTPGRSGLPGFVGSVWWSPTRVQTMRSAR